MIWWDGHMDGLLRISDENEFYWHCENDIWIDPPGRLRKRVIEGVSF